MATTTIDTDTELSAVNSILGAIGQAPISQLKDPNTGNITNDNPEIKFIFNLLKDSNIDVQSEGWHFNTERHKPFQKDGNNKIAIAADVVRIDLPDNWTRKTFDFVRRNGFLYDKITHKDDFPDMPATFDLDVVKVYPFEDTPIPFRRHITYRASRMAATQLVANPALVRLLAGQESISRAALIEYECNQGNHTMFGFEDNTVHQTYQPWRNLRR